MKEKGGMIVLRGKRVYIEVSGPLDGPVLLYLHGGPGTGSYDFNLYQSYRLSHNLRLVLMDQYGVLRSDPLDESERFGLQKIIKDCEALRKHLEIKGWSVLGHSFGGYLAIRYALEYPDPVERLVLESPTLDLASSARSLLRGAAIEYRRVGRITQAEECLKASEDTKSPEEVWEDFSSLTKALGDLRNNLYVHGQEKDFFDQLVANSPFPKEWWKKQDLFQLKLYTEKKVFKSLIPRLSEIRCPILLIKGKYDWVSSDDQIEAFHQETQNGRIIVFNDSGHFPRVEEPARYAQIVSNFILEGKGKNLTMRAQ